MKNIARMFCLIYCCLWGSLAWAWDIPKMAKYGAAYAGPELLYVYVAHNQADDHAVIKINGVNHAFDGRVFWAEVRYQPGYPERALYVIRENNHERPLFFVNGQEGRLTLPNWRGQAQVEIALHYDRTESVNTQPEHLASDYERQIQQQ